MLTNYFKIALRTMRREKGYAFIHLAGLAVGMAACLLIGLYVHDELQYDTFHTNADRTYRVLREFDIPDLHSTIPTTPPALAPALEERVPTIEAAVRIHHTSPIVQVDLHKAIESDFLWADPGFFEVFSFPILQGEATLERPGTVILTAGKAATYFPDEDPIGKTLQVDDQDLTVTGIMADVPSASHLQAGFVGSLSTSPPSLNWGYNNYVTYVLLAEGTSKETVAQQVVETIEANTNPTGAERAGNDFIPHLQPITGIHLGQGVDVEIGSQGNPLYVYLFVVLAGFIILLACINFMNLATARSAGRTREIGIRKALGARREQLGAQFLGESLFMSMIALVLALFLIDIGLPALNQLVGKSLSTRPLYEGTQILALLGLGVFVGLLAGTYPALVLSHFRPALVLKGTLEGPRGHRLRKGLVVFQFAISMALIAGTGITQSQLHYMRSAGLGFDRENVVLIKQAGYLGDGLDAFQQELEKLSDVQRVTSGFSMPGTFFINSMWQPSIPGAKAQNMDYSFVGFDYIETLGIEMVAGRSLSRAFPTDSFAVMLNETAVKDFGWSVDEAIGQTISPSWGNDVFTVVGVTRDFHYRSLHAELYPMALFGPRRTPHYVAARIASDNAAKALKAIQSLWKQFSDLPLAYTFLADDLAAKYRTEEQLTKVFGVFSGLAILIAGLGLFGLSAFTIEQRTKEIGIRKVLGATVIGLIARLSQDFLKLVLIAFFVAVPIAYWAMQRWLEDFAYRIELSWTIFLGAGLTALGVALLTVSYQAVRAALADPVKALRYE